MSVLYFFNFLYYIVTVLTSCIVNIIFSKAEKSLLKLKQFCASFKALALYFLQHLINLPNHFMIYRSLFNGLPKCLSLMLFVPAKQHKGAANSFFCLSWSRPSLSTKRSAKTNVYRFSLMTHAVNKPGMCLELNFSSLFLHGSYETSV